MPQVNNIGKSDNFKTWRDNTNLVIDLINVKLQGTPTLINTLKDLINYMQSAGIISGCIITDNLNGTIDVAAGEALIRETSTEGAEIYSVVVPASVALILTDNEINYIYVDYNTGTPVVSVTVNSGTVNDKDKILIALISREGNDLTILEAQEESADVDSKIRKMLVETDGFRHVISGTALEDKGNKKFGITAGAFYRGLTKYAHVTVDTSGADTFEYYYKDGVGGWTEVVGQTVIDSLNYDDGTGTLASLTAGKYSVHWVYMKLGSNKQETYVLYGTVEHNTISDAKTEEQPAAIPPVLDGLGVLIGRIIILQNDTTLSLIESVFKTSFVAGAPSDHNNLSNLQGGIVGERYHLSNTEHTNVLAHLTDTANPHFVTPGQIGAEIEGTSIAMAIALS